MVELQYNSKTLISKKDGSPMLINCLINIVKGYLSDSSYSKAIKYNDHIGELYYKDDVIEKQCDNVLE